MLRLQNTILEMVAKGESLERTAERLCREIEDLVPSVVCSLLTVDAAGLLHPLAAPSLPDHYSAALDGVAIGPKAGSCGTAAYLRRSVAVTDIASDERWAPFRELALPLGLKACWSTPICDDRGRVLGTFAFYYRECRGPSALEEQLVVTCVHLCSIALERHARVMERERLANVDALTGLANRLSFNNAISKLSCDEPGAWALFVADLDNLKVVNDTFGHQTGDALIRVVAGRIEEACRPDRVFRIGGDEFAIIVLDENGLADLDALARRVLDAVGAPAECNDHLIQPRITIGGAVVSAMDRLVETVRQNADFALYHAKEMGRGRFVRYWAGLGTAITHRLTAIRDVQLALREDRVDAYYQPIVRLDTGEIVGVEALCRVIAPDGRVIPAADFCEATADANVASDMTELMLERAARDYAGWLNLGIEIDHLSFNISSADFHLGKLHRQVAEAFRRRNLPLERLIVEVTEGVYLGRHDSIIAREINALRKKGLRVALDDFGTGFASLTHLLTVPVDVIKIDKTFIEGLAPNGPSSVILAGIFDIARNLGITVIAEGIETQEQATQLKRFGCPLGQGFLYSPAVDRGTITAMLSEQVGRKGAVAA